MATRAAPERGVSANQAFICKHRVAFSLIAGHGRVNQFLTVCPFSSNKWSFPARYQVRKPKPANDTDVHLWLIHTFNQSIIRRSHLQLEWPLGKLLHPSRIIFASVCVQIAEVTRPYSGLTIPEGGWQREMQSVMAKLADRSRIIGKAMHTRPWTPDCNFCKLCYSTRKSEAEQHCKQEWVFIGHAGHQSNLRWFTYAREYHCENPTMSVLIVD